VEYSHEYDADRIETVIALARISLSKVTKKDLFMNLVESNRIIINLRETVRQLEDSESELSDFETEDIKDQFEECKRKAMQASARLQTEEQVNKVLCHQITFLQETITRLIENSN
jgi:hypothetical protein